MKTTSDDKARVSGSYSRTFFFTLLTMLAATAGFCTLVDPYGIFGMPRIAHVTAVKSAAAARLRLSKAYGVERAQPATIVTGSSVTNLGIDPDSSAWSAKHRPVFNLGIDGATLDMQRRFLLHALSTTHPKRVVLITCFEDFMPLLFDAGGGDVGGLEMRVGEDGRPDPGYALRHFKDLASATLSFRALADSATTLVRQSGDWLRYQTAAGFEISSPEEQYAALQGSRAAIAKVDIEIAARLLKWKREPQWSVEPMADMVRAARQAGADVAVIIPPAYADLVELRRQLDLSASVQAWHVELARIVDAEAQASGATHIALWNFGGLTPYTTALPPERGNMADPSRWFWDSAHFSPALGTLMIKRIETGEGPDDLGSRLDTASLAADEAAFDAAQRAWVQAHPADVEHISAIIASATRKLCDVSPGSCDPSAVSLLFSD